MQKRKSSGWRVLLIVLLALAALVIVAVGAVVAVFLIFVPQNVEVGPSSQPSPIVAQSTVVAEVTAETPGETAVAMPAGYGRQLSPDQQRLVDRFSYPETFVLIMAADESSEQGELMRVEMWNYHVLGTCFQFVNGEFTGVDEAIELEVHLSPPGFRPDEFDETMTLEQVTAVVGFDPIASANLVPEITGNASMYRYKQGLIAGFQDGKLVYMMSEPVAVGGD